MQERKAWHVRSTIMTVNATVVGIILEYGERAFDPFRTLIEGFLERDCLSWSKPWSINCFSFL